jgi:hemerythrin-like domain-containing protein
MFLTYKLIAALEKDHNILREHLGTLKDKDANLKDIKRAFLELVPELNSHTKREEQVLYKFLLTKSELKQMGHEGFEEHSIVNQLLKALEAKPQHNDKWRAKAKTMAEIIEHHLNEEESQVFPQVKKYLTTDLDEELCHRYLIADHRPKKASIKRDSPIRYTNIIPRAIHFLKEMTHESKIL